MRAIGNRFDMIYAEDIRKIILKTAEEYGPERTFWPSDVARKIDRENWMIIVQQVSMVADTMIREGKILLTQPNGPLKYKKH